MIWKRNYCETIRWRYIDGHWQIYSTDGEILNMETQECFVNLPAHYQLSYCHEDRVSTLDGAGYIAFAIGGDYCSLDIENYTFVREDANCNPDDRYIYLMGGVRGCLNRYGEVAIEAKYKETVYFEDEKITSATYIDSNGCEQIDYINSQGESIKQRSGYTICSSVSDDCSYYFVESRGRYGVIDHDWDIVIPAIFRDKKFDNNNYSQWAVLQSCINGKWGIVCCSNNIILPFIYDDIDIESNIAWIGDKWWAFNKYGTIHDDSQTTKVTNFVDVAVPEERKTMEEEQFYYYTVINKFDKYGLIQNLSETDYSSETYDAVIPCEYDAVADSSGCILTDDELQEITHELFAIGKPVLRELSFMKREIDPDGLEFCQFRTYNHRCELIHEFLLLFDPR